MTPPIPWSAPRRAAFRFAFCYLILYNLPFPLSLPPFGGPLADQYNKVWRWVIPWIGTHLWHLATPITVFPSGTGDTRYNYIQILVFALLALGGTIVWPALRRGRLQYARLQHGLRIYIRYALAVPLLVYGAAKVIQLQFPTPTLSLLVQPFGEFTPMSVLWSWMGISRPYNIYAGLAEMIPGFLLLFRRTATLGALLGAAALSNVVMLNFAYDVPVKLFSSHLLLMAGFLLIPDARRLLDAFVLNRPVPALDLDPFPTTGRRRRTVRMAKVLVVLLAVAVPLAVVRSLSARVGGVASRPPLYGIYEVDSFVRNRDTLPPVLGDSVRWRRVVVTWPGFIAVQLMNDEVRPFSAVVDTGARLLTLAAARDSSRKSRLSYAVAGDQLAIDGPLGPDTVHLRLRRIDQTKVPALSHRFRWVTE